MKKRLSLNVTSLILCAMIAFIPAAEARKEQHPDTYSEGKLLTPSVTVGPFDLHRKYRSMEGPYADKEVAIGELVSSGHQVVGEEMVRFVETGGQESMSAQPSTFSTSV